MHRLIFCRDEPLLHELARSFVGRQDFELIPAASGEEMIEMASRRGAELLIAPIRLIDMSSRELCERLAAQTPAPPPVLLIGPDSERIASLAAGAGAFVPTPWTRSQILSSIRSFFQVPERGAARAEVSLKVLCGGGTETYLAFTKDISATGMFLKGEAPAQPGSRLRLRVWVSDEGSEEELDLTGEVVRRVSDEGEGRRHQGLGLRFVDLPMVKKLPITRFVRRLAGDEGVP